MPPEAPQTYQEALDKLAEFANANGDCFRLKLLRRPNASSSITEHVATFADATWRHVADAESWIAPFCGGGLYVFQVFDGKDARKQYGVITPAQIPGAPRQPNFALCRSAAWTGPVLVGGENGVVGAGAGAVATGSPFPFLAGEPWNTGGRRDTSPEAGLSGLFEESRRRGEELRQQEALLAERERKAEAEAVRRETREQVSRLEQRIADLVAAQAKPIPLPPAPPPLDVVGLVGALAGIASPIVTAIMAAADRAKAAQLEVERERVRREDEAKAKDREERALEREERKAQAAALASKPLIDPQLMEVMKQNMEQARGQAAQFAELMKAQAESARANAESSAVATRSMLQTVTDVAQLQVRMGSGEEKEGIDWGKVIAGALGGLAALKGAPGMAPGMPGPGMAGVPGAPGAVQPGQLPAGQPIQQVQQAPPDVPESPTLDKIEDKIRAKAPPSEVVEDLRKGLETADAKAEIAAFPDGLMGVMNDRLGDFVEDKANAKYMEALTVAFEKSGLFG